MTSPGAKAPAAAGPVDRDPASDPAEGPPDTAAGDPASVPADPARPADSDPARNPAEGAADTAAGDPATVPADPARPADSDPARDPAEGAADTAAGPPASVPAYPAGPTASDPAGGSGGKLAGPVDTRVRPLRRDAERNRQRILRAAGEVFTERGLGATLDDVARKAGVGVGTVYRRFPDKEALADALFAKRIDEVASLAERALTEPDPWQALASFLADAAAVLAGDRGLRQILMFATYGRDRVGHARAKLQPLVTALVERAQEAGVVRADLQPTDIPLIEFMLGSAAEYAQHVRPGIWRRYLALILDGMRPSRAGTTPLPEPALAPDEMERAMRSRSLRSH